MRIVNQLSILICTFYLLLTLFTSATLIKEIDTDRSPGVGKATPTILEDEGNPMNGKVIGTVSHNPTTIKFIDIGTVSASEGALLSIENGRAIWKKGHGFVVQSNVGTFSTVLLAIMTALLLITTRFGKGSLATS